MTTDLLPKGGVGDELNERANRAVKAFRSLQPTLTAYARALSGRMDVRVDIAAKDNGSTDGARIYYRPPYALGDNTPHERRLCDKRDEDQLHLCPACRIREEVLVTIYHEIAHICFDSFATTTSEDKLKAIQFAVRGTKGPWAEKIAERIKSAPKWRTDSYISLASLVNEFLPILVNALEDARVNRELFNTRPGTKRMFDADTRKIFREGYECADGTRKWTEAPLNMQAIVGVFCKASGYDYSNWFHKKVVEALNDEELTLLVNEMDHIRSAGGVYELSFRVLARLRELGFCGTPRDPDPEPEEDSDGSENGEPDSDSVPGESDAESGDESEDEGECGNGSESNSVPQDDESDSASEGESSSSGSGSNSEESESDDSNSEDTQSGESDPVAGGVDTNPDQDGEASSDSSSSGPSGQGAMGESDDDSDDNNTPEEAGGSVDESDTDSVPGEAESAGGMGGSDSGPRPSDDSTDQEAEEEGEFSDPDGSHATSEGEAGSDSSGSDQSGDERNNQSSEESDNSEDATPIDTGADDGYGGTSVLEEDDDKEEEESAPEMGTPDDVKEALLKWGDHEEKPKSIAAKKEEEAVDKAIVQGIYFTRPSNTIFGVREHFYGQPIIEGGINYSKAWEQVSSASARVRRGQTTDLEVPEQVLQPALLKMRRAFSDNQRGAMLHNKKSGRVNAKVLGKRAWNDDARLFQKKVLPGKKDYFVVIGVDISASTHGVNIALEKRAVSAQATLLARMGVPFAIYAHTGNYHDGRSTSLGLDLEVYHLKDANEPWSDKTQERLEAIGPSSANLDGHALEFLRKAADKSNATDKIIMYYSDGKMPAENHDEELAILTHEIAQCRHKGYTLLGVGIRTDSPARHGLDTVEVHEDSDLAKVVDHLGKRLSDNV